MTLQVSLFFAFEVEAIVSLILDNIPLGLDLKAVAICSTWFSKFLMLTPLA
jgi:hypothetical protein